MNDTAAISAGPSARLAVPARGGAHPAGADFAAALADAQGHARPAKDRSTVAGGGTHVVKAGETLYGIARARLARAGQAATAVTTMRYALDIARTNQIRNPDRIYAGQTLSLSPPPGTTAGADPAGVHPGKGAAYAHTGASPAPHEPHWRRDMTAVDVPDEAAESGIAAANATEPEQAEPPILAAAASRELATRDAARSRADRDQDARADLALYRNAAASASPSPAADVPDLLYKGIVGKALDKVPLEPSTRTGLQQANAVVGGAFAGRSLAALTGLGGPLLTVAGLLWGIFSAQKIGAGQSAAANPLAQNTTAAAKVD